MKSVLRISPVMPVSFSALPWFISWIARFHYQGIYSRRACVYYTSWIFTFLILIPHPLFPCPARMSFVHNPFSDLLFIFQGDWECRMAGAGVVGSLQLQYGSCLEYHLSPCLFYLPLSLNSQAPNSVLWFSNHGFPPIVSNDTLSWETSP